MHRHFCGLAFCALASAAVAANVEAQARDNTADELYVIGQRLEETTPQQLAELGNRLVTLTADQLRLGGFDDLGQSLQMAVPGLYVAPKNGAFDYINCSLQGSRCQDVLWLVDGVRTSNRLYATTTPLDTIPANMIERVEVLYGGQGIFYGTQSIAGVVNVVTKSFSDRPTGSLGLGLDENDGRHLNGDYRTAIGKHQVAFYVSKDQADGFQPFPSSDIEPSATDRKRGYDSLIVGAKYGYNFSDESRLTLLYQRTDNDLDFLRPYETAVGKNERSDDWITAKWDRSLGTNADLYVKGYWHDWDSHFTEIFNDLDANGALTGTRTVDSDHLFWGFKDYGVTAVAQFRNPGSFAYAVGYDYQRFWGEDEVWLIEDKTETAQAVYGQIRTTREQLKNTNLALGLRYNKTSGTFDGTVWNFSGQHDFTSSFYLRGQIGTSFRLADAEQLYVHDCCEVGNPNLEPEESTNVEVGIGGRSDAARGVSWQLIAFSREITNLIDIDYSQAAFPDGIYENVGGKIKAHGWEVGVNVGLSEAMTLGLDYTSSVAKDVLGAQLQDNPKSFYKLDWTYRGTSTPLDFSVALLHVGEVFDNVSSFGSIEHGDYTVIDIGAGYYLDRERHHRIGARLENALDEAYATSLGRGIRDVDGSFYAYRNLGTPRTLHATYTYSF
jgi:vitamin B12 transporter